VPQGGLRAKGLGFMCEIIGILGSAPVATSSGCFEAPGIKPARAFAEAQVDIDRIRNARHELLSRGLGDPVDAALEKSAAGRFAVTLSDQVGKLARLVAPYHAASLRRGHSIQWVLQRGSAPRQVPSLGW
jgi:hypothetical protein